MARYRCRLSRKRGLKRSQGYRTVPARIVGFERPVTKNRGERQGPSSERRPPCQRSMAQTQPRRALRSPAARHSKRRIFSRVRDPGERPPCRPRRPDRLLSSRTAKMRNTSALHAPFAIRQTALLHSLPFSGFARDLDATRRRRVWTGVEKGVRRNQRIRGEVQTRQAAPDRTPPLRLHVTSDPLNQRMAGTASRQVT